VVADLHGFIDLEPGFVFFFGIEDFNHVFVFWIQNIIKVIDDECDGYGREKVGGLFHFQLGGDKHGDHNTESQAFKVDVTAHENDVLVVLAFFGG